MERVGIYLVINVVNGKVYVGSSKQLRRRNSQHFQDLRRGAHPNAHLQRSWDEYGEPNFEFEVVEYCGESDLLEREDWWIDFLDSMNPAKGYNLRTADRQIFTSEVRERIRRSKLGHFVSPATREKLRQSRLGKPLSNDARSKLRNSLTGRKRSNETCERIGLAHRGKVLSSETRKKLRQANLGKIQSPETIARRRQTHIGQTRPIETRQRIASAKAQEWLVTSPDGTSARIRDLKAFCAENDLSNSKMGAVAAGRRPHHKGWLCQKIETEELRSPHREAVVETT